MPAVETSVPCAIVTDVQRFSVHDGPGIRTLVFFKGCPLRCLWCHNPETQRAEPEIRFQPARCIGCGTCAAVCPRGAQRRGPGRDAFDRSRCVACGSCAAACPAGALERVGEERSIANLVAIALRDAPFYGRDGGITVSGGEPLAQPDALFALLAAAREAGMTTCVETCGAFDPALAPRLATLADTILFDLKDTDSDRLRVNTGADLNAILRTLRALDAAGANLALRCVLIPGVNLCDAHAHGIVDIFRTLVHARSVELLPYHALGAGKAESLGREQHIYPVPTAADLDAFAAVLRANNIPLHDEKPPLPQLTTDLEIPTALPKRLPPRGAARLAAVEDIPVLDRGARIGYVGSIDPSGGNEDWDWGEVQDENGEWILFEDEGPGCVFNFTQHRGETSEVPVFRFYFDGEMKPRLEVRPKDFGACAALPPPLSGAFCIDDRESRPFRIVRSFVPMEYRSGCRITSSIALRGKDPEGGWGHVLYHHYDSPDGLATYSPATFDAAALSRMFENGLGRAGGDSSATPFVLAAGASFPAFAAEGRGALTETALTIPEFNPAAVTNLWLVFEFDGMRTAEAPLGTFFGCLTPQQPTRHETALLTFDTSAPSAATFSNRFPMPFFKSCRVTLENRGDGDVSGTVSVAMWRTDRYDPVSTGLFTAAPFRPWTVNKAGRNAFIGRMTGRGCMAYAVIAGRDTNCEGDVRCFIDDMTVPRVQSDGSESWGSWGWGFSRPPQTNPFSCYNGTGDGLWSELRLTYADAYNFRRFLRFELEHGGRNDTPGSLSAGQLFGYILR